MSGIEFDIKIKESITSKTALSDEITWCSAINCQRESKVAYIGVRDSFCNNVDIG
jgi:hypothetical protein